MRKLFMILFLTSFIACKQKVDNKITIGVPSTLSGLPIQMMNEMVIQDKIINVEFYGDHITSMAEFLTGGYDIICTGFTQGVANSSQNDDIVCLNTIVWGASSILTSDLDITNFDEIKIMNISLPFQGSPLDIMFNYITKEKGNRDNFIVHYIPFQQAIAAMQSGRMDAVIVPEPIATVLSSSNKAKRLVSMNDLWASVNNGEGRTPQVSIFTKKLFISEQDQFIKAFFGELQNQISKVNDSSYTYTDEIIEKYSIEKKIFIEAITNIVFDLPDAQTHQKLANDYLIETRFEHIPDDSFYYDYKL